MRCIGHRPSVSSRPQTQPNSVPHPGVGVSVGVSEGVDGVTVPGQSRSGYLRNIPSLPALENTPSPADCRHLKKTMQKNAHWLLAQASVASFYSHPGGVTFFAPGTSWDLLGPPPTLLDPVERPVPKA